MTEDSLESRTSDTYSRPQGSLNGTLSPQQSNALNAPQDLEHFSEPHGQTLGDALVMQPARANWRVWARRLSIPLLTVLVVVSGILVAVHRGNAPLGSVKAGDFNEQSLPLSSIAPPTAIDTSQILKVNGQLQVASALILSPTVTPATAIAGQIYYDQSTNQLAYYNGNQYVQVGSGSTSNTSIQNTTNVTNLFSTVTNATAGITTPNGTVGSLLKFTGLQTAGNSIASDNSTFLQIAGGLNLIASTTITNLSFWTPAAAPAAPNFADPLPVELGLKFTTDVPGVVNGVKFYRGTTSNGPYVGSLWTGGGTLLAQATFTVSGLGWQEVKFSAPIAISPNTTYIVSYHTSGGGYAADSNYFGSGGIDNGPIHALTSGVDGGNGVFRYSATPAFPNQTASSANYWADVDFSGATYSADSRIRINGAQISSSDLSNDNNLAKLASAQIFSGHNIFRNGSDSSDAFDIQKADTTPLFTVDSLDSRVYIGPGGGSNTPVVLVLGGKSNGSTDPAGVEGAIYYNYSLESFRCYQQGHWSECGDVTPDHGFSVYDEFMGGQTTSFGTNNIIGSLGWNAQAIGANGSIDFNPSNPTPVADRPGVLVLTTPAVTNEGTTLLLGHGSAASMILEASDDFKSAVAVSTTTGQVLRVGLHTETTATTQPVSGVWWEADPTVNPDWRYCYGTGTAAVCADSTLAIAANTWVRLEIQVTATGTGTSAAVYKVNGTTMANVSNVTIDSTTRLSPAFSCYATGNNAQSCFWDYFQLRGTTSAVR